MKTTLGSCQSSQWLKQGGGIIAKKELFLGIVAGREASWREGPGEVETSTSQAPEGPWGDGKTLSGLLGTMYSCSQSNTAFETTDMSPSDHHWEGFRKGSISPYHPHLTTIPQASTLACNYCPCLGIEWGA